LDRSIESVKVAFSSWWQQLLGQPLQLSTNSQALHRHLDQTPVLDHPRNEVLAIPLTRKDDNMVARM
jgi:hypothetical protein